MSGRFTQCRDAVLQSRVVQSRVVQSRYEPLTQGQGWMRNLIGDFALESELIKQFIQLLIQRLVDLLGLVTKPQFFLNLLYTQALQ